MPERIDIEKEPSPNWHRSTEVKECGGPAFSWTWVGVLEQINAPPPTPHLVLAVLLCTV